MTVMMETCLIIALSFAVFSAVATVGASLALGIGYERLRAGFEVIRKQTGFFSDQIYKLDKRVETLEKDEQHAPSDKPAEDRSAETDQHSYLTVDSGVIAQARREQNSGVAFDTPSASAQRMLLEGDFRPEGIRFH